MRSASSATSATLKGEPVAVGYPAKRGVVAAASYEARSFGVRSAMPSTVAIRKRAELVFVPPRVRRLPRSVQTSSRDLQGLHPLVEPLSLDEAYLDVTDNLKSIPTAWETARKIRARIYEETRLTASAGISCNKFLAKLASDYRKPNGQFAILPGQAEAFVAALPAAKFHGVGPKTRAKMRTLGIETGADLRRQALSLSCSSNFGKAGSLVPRHRARPGRPARPSLTGSESHRDIEEFVKDFVDRRLGDLAEPAAWRTGAGISIGGLRRSWRGSDTRRAGGCVRSTLLG